MNEIVDCGSRPIEDSINARKRREVERPIYTIAEPPRKEKIVGGDAAAHGMFPWQVGIRRGYTISGIFTSHYCGATIISEYWVLSAAHCFSG